MEDRMRLRLLAAMLGTLAFAPAAQANDPPYPACSPPAPFTWHAGQRVFATSLYVVRLNTDATEVWTRVGAGGAWRRSPARHDAHGTWTTIRPAMGAGALAVGFRSTNAGAPCLALEERTFTVKQRFPLDRLRAVVAGRGVLRVSGFRSASGCDSLGGGSFKWRFVVDHKRRFLSLGNACGLLNGDGAPTRGARVRTRFFTILSGTAARRRAPASYLVVRAAHPRRSGTVRFNLSAISADLPSCSGCHVAHQHIVTIGVLVIVRFDRGARPAWHTTVQFGRPFPRTPASGGNRHTNGNTGLGGGGSDSPAGGSGSCSGIDC
jgi:hypothetical protein